MGNAFHNLQSKKRLRELLYIDKSFIQLESDGFFNNMFNIYIASKRQNNGDVKRRLVESPRADVKIIHKRIHKLLSKIELPVYLYSKKGISYLDNHSMHKKTYVVKLDISKFFPNCRSDRIYKYFHEDLSMSKDCSYWITKMITVDMDKEQTTEKVLEYIKEISLRQRIPISLQHLPTGSPLSPLVSFLIHRHLFDKIYEYCSFKEIDFTLYVDDVTLSSTTKISDKTIYDIIHLFHQFGLPVSKKKTVIYKANHDKLITGVVVNRYNEVKVPNKLHKKRKDLQTICKKSENIKDYNRLRGVENAITQILKRRDSKS